MAGLVCVHIFGNKLLSIYAIFLSIDELFSHASAFNIQGENYDVERFTLH